MTLQKAKKEIRQLLHRWMVVRDTNISQKDPYAPITTIATIEQYLQKECQPPKLSAEEFQELIAFALEEAQTLPLRLETTEYFYGEIRRTVERKEFTQLKHMLARYLLSEPVAWSASLQFVAAQVLPAAALIFAFSVVPAAAAIIPRNSPDVDSTGSALAVDYTQSHPMANLMKTHSDALMSEEWIQPTAHIKTQAEIQTVETLANELLHFYEESLGSGEWQQQEELIQRLLNDDNVMQHLNVILIHSSNKALLYPMLVKLTHKLYDNMLTRENVANRDSLLVSLGQAIMTMPKTTLANDLSENEIHTMIGVLFSYQPYHADESAVRARIQDLFLLSRTTNDYGSTLIYRVVTYNPAQKKIAQAHFQALFNESKKLFSNVPKGDPTVSFIEEQYAVKFMRMYSRMSQIVIELFDADNSVVRFNLVKEIYTLAKEQNNLAVAMLQSPVPDNNSVRFKFATVFIEIHLKMVFARLNKDLTECETIILDSAKKWGAHSSKMDIKLMKILLIFRHYFGYVDMAKEYFHIIEDLLVKHRVTSQEIAQQEKSINRIFALGSLAAIKPWPEPVTLAHFKSTDIKTQGSQSVLVYLVRQLRYFAEGAFKPEEKIAFIQGLLNNDTYMQSLNIILMESDNPEWQQRMTAKLSSVFYEMILEMEMENSDSMIISLGRAIMAVPKKALIKDFSKHEIQSMTMMLFLYQPYAAGKAAVGERINDICDLPDRINDFCPILIYRLLTYDAPQKKKAQAHFSALLEESMRLFPARDKYPPGFTEDQRIPKFLEMYPKMLKAIIELFDAENSLERLDLLKTSSGLAPKILALKGEEGKYYASYMQQMSFCIDISLTMAFKRIDKDRTMYENALLGSAKEWDKDLSKTGIKLLKILIIYRQFSGYPEMAQEYYDIIRNLQVKHRIEQQEFVEKENGFSQTLKLEHLEPIEIFSVPKVEGGFMEKILSPEAFLGLLLGGIGVGFFHSMHYFSKPPKELSTLMQNIIESSHCADLIARPEYYHTEGWITQMHYGVYHYKLLALFSLEEQATLLAKVLSTLEFTVGVIANQNKFKISIKPNQWLPDWRNYFEYVQKHSQLAIRKELYEKLKKWIKTHLSNIKFAELFHLLPGREWVVVSFEWREDPSIQNDLCNLFKENAMGMPIEDIGKLNLLIPFDALFPEGGCETEFSKKLKRINEDWVKVKISIESIGGIEISTESKASLRGYLLHRLRLIDAKIKTNSISRDFSQAEEPGLIVKNIMAVFKTLKERYAPAVCELVFIDKKIKIRISFTQDQVPHGLSTEQSFKLVQRELEENGFVINQAKQPLSLDIAVGEKRIIPQFAADLATVCQQECERITLEDKQKQAAQKTLEYHKVMAWLNIRLNDSIPNQNLEWRPIKAKEGMIEVVLQEPNYYTGGGMQILRNALMALIKEDLQKNGGVEEKCIFMDKNNNPFPSRQIGVKQWDSVKMNDAPMGQKIFMVLEKLVLLYFPMSITLDYVNEEFKVCLELEESNAYKIEPYGLSSSDFVDCVQESLGGKNNGTRDGLKLSIAFILLEAIQLTDTEKFFKEKQQRCGRDIFLPGKDKEKEKEKEEDKGKDVDRGKEQEKGKKHKQKPSKLVQLTMLVTKPKHPQGVSSYHTQVFLRRPIIKFNEKETKDEIDKLFILIEGDLRELTYLEKGGEGIKAIRRQFSLYINLSNLLEKLVKCDSQFSREEVIKPKWFNILDPKHLPELRAFIIKSINHPNHMSFCMFVAGKMMNMKKSSIFLINIEDIIQSGLTQAVLKEYCERGKLEVEESAIDYDEIRAHVSTLKNTLKGDSRELNLWLQQNSNFARALIVRTVELFNKKDEASSHETKQHLGESLYAILKDDFRPYRNKTIHAPGEESFQLMNLIEKLSTVSVEKTVQNDHQGSSSVIRR